MACSRCSRFPPVSGIYSGWAEVQVSGDGIRSKHCLPNILQNNVLTDQGTKGAWREHSGIPGRRSDLARFRAGVSRSPAPSLGDIRRPRFSSEFRKIQTQTSQGVRMAGFDMEYHFRDIISPSPSSPESIENDSKISGSEEFFSPISSEAFGHSKFCRNSGSDPEMQTQGLVPFSRGLQSEAPKSDENYSTPAEGVNLEVAPTKLSRFHGASSSTDSNPGHLHRCLTKGLGFPHIAGRGEPGSMADIYAKVSYKYPRVRRSLLSLEACGSSRKRPGNYSQRQHDSSQYHSEGRIGEVSSAQRLDDVSLTDFSTEELCRFSGAHIGSPESDSGYTFEGFTSADRMVSRQRVLSMGVLFGSLSPRGSICDEEKSPNREFCFPDSRPQSNRLRCSSAELEPLDVNLHISANQPAHEGGDEIEVLQGLCSPNSTAVAECPMVSPTAAIVRADTNSASSAATDNMRKDFLRRILDDPTPSRMAVLGSFYELNFSADVAPYLCANIRPSSQRQYESVWRKFVAFVKDLPIPVINVKSVMEFFVHSFESGGHPSTIQS